MRITVSLDAEYASPWMDLFAQALPEAAIERRDRNAPVRPAAPAPDFVVMTGSCTTVLVESPRPRALFATGAGIAHVLRLSSLPPDLPVIRMEDAGMADQMVRYVLAVALRVCGYGDAYRAQQQTARWEQHPPRDPASLRVGVLGLGVIGGEIARALARHGFAVRGHARSARSIAGVECYAGMDALPDFLSGLDLLVCVVPDTPDTADLLDRHRLALLADGAHVVNIGRGSVLVDDDLVALLDSGKLGGATLDVFRKEPLSPEHPFWRHPAITITPHVSGITIPSATVAQIAGKMRQLMRGERVTGVVDRARGY